MITDGDGKVEGVRPGVVGRQPHLSRRAVQYTSGCVPETPRGGYGTYQMVRPDGSMFDAVIAPFYLSLPFSLN